ncbi:hypothetical protein E4U14_007442 [Claviceps sp. LM454 group G7]|nr:hypothetical protein E4U14_007442 [Claviceps sp. LM454 group G7]
MHSTIRPHACDARAAMKTSCTIGITIPTAAKRITSPACLGTIRQTSKGAHEYLAVNIGLAILSILVTTARLVYKRYYSSSRRYGPEDWVVVAIMVFSLPCAVVNITGLVQHGMGRDTWTLSTRTVSQFALYFWILESLYLLDIALVKMALLAFYMTIFPSASTGPWTRRLLWGCVVFNSTLAIASILVTLFQCRPVSYYWRQFVDNGIDGFCIPSAPLAYVNGSLNVALDLWMIMIPLYRVRTLQLHWKHKAGVVIMFLMGTFITIVSTFRLASLSNFDDSINMTMEYYDVALWSTIEINVGVVGVSLPTIRLILVRISPRVFGSQESILNQSRPSLPCSDLVARRQMRLSSVAAVLGIEEEDEDEEQEEEERYAQQEEASP